MFYNLGIATKCGKIRGCTMGENEYKEEITKLVNECENAEWLECIYVFVKTLLS